MTKQIKFEGKIHAFPDDATEDEINEVLGGKPEESFLNKASNEVEGAYHMPLGRSLKNLGQGAIDFGEFATNPAGPAMKYLASKDIPYISKLAKHWPQYPESDVFGLGEQQPGDILFQTASPIGTIGKGADIAAHTLLNTLNKAPKAIEKIADIGSVLKSKAATPYTKFKEPHRNLEENQSLQSKIEQGLENREQQLAQEHKETINPYLNKELVNLNEKTGTNQKNITQLFPEVTKPQLLENTVNQFQKHGQEIIKESNKLYENFGKGQYGKKSIEEPFNIESIKNETNKLYGLGKTTKQTLGDRSQEVSHYIDAAGAPKSIIYPAKNAIVNDYVTLMRELRDASFNMRKQAKNATAGEAEKLYSTANKLKSLQEETANKIKNTIGNEGWNEFEKIQKHYADYRAPLTEQVSFRNPIFNKTVGSNPFDKLAQPKYAALRERLLSKPEFREQFIQHQTQGAKHPLHTGLQNMSPETRSLLSPQQNFELQLRDSLRQQREHFTQARAQLNKSDKLLPTEREHIQSYSPEMRHFVSRILHEKLITNQMRQEAKQLGFNEKELQNIVDKRDRLLGIAKTVTGIKGLDWVVGLIKKGLIG